MGTLRSPLGSICLQERDLVLLKGLFESRIMTAGHAAAIYFDGRREAAKKRLQRLKAAGYVGERKRRIVDPSLLFLTTDGLRLLRDHGVLAEYPPIGIPTLARRAQISEATVRHEIEVMDVKAAFHAALRRNEKFSIAEFCTWPRLIEFKASPNSGPQIIVRPDGFIRIRKNEPGEGLPEHTFFLEVDRSTETQDALVSKATCYLDYYRSGGFAVRNGAPRSEFKDYPFRVLMVFKTAERMNNTAERLLQNNPPILTQVCLSTIAEVMTDPLGAIWIRPQDYRESSDHQPVAFSHQDNRFYYRSQATRDRRVERNVKKRPILS